MLTNKASRQENRVQVSNQQSVPNKTVMLALPPVPRSQIKSRERVRDMAEVYTRDEEITAMLDLVGDISHNVETRFLEPSAGNGNFLVRILDRKLARALHNTKASGKRRAEVQKDFEFYAVMAFASIYAVDIDPENVLEARQRLWFHLKDLYSCEFNTLRPTAGFYDAIQYVLRLNIQVGDMLEGTAGIAFTEFSAPKPRKFTQRVFRLNDLLAGDLPASGLFKARKPVPIQVIPMRNYWELADA